MSHKSLYRTSRFLSLVLRHQPDRAGIRLNGEGWVAVDELLKGLAANGYVISTDDLEQIVRENDKKRFAFNDERTMIRASQGHSAEVDLGYTPAEPPERLYHGTVERFLPSIRQHGLKPQNRHHVHLSPDMETAEKVGKRRGTPVILTIRAGAMHTDNMIFFVSDNGVWLTEHVAPHYIANI